MSGDIKATDIEYPKYPKNPDPAPKIVGETSSQVQQAKRDQRKKVSSQYGRGKTILTGNDSTTNENKKTILGG